MARPQKNRMKGYQRPLNFSGGIMFRNLIRQELLSHLMSARFFAAVVITLLLVVANAVVLLKITSVDW